MFIAYMSQNGKNVTVSPRIASQGHNEPKWTKDVTVSLFEGSGIQNGIFSVNAMCTGCRKWSGGSLDTTNTKENMIYAIGPAWGLESDELDAPLRQHQVHDGFSMDLVRATGIGGVPVLSAGASAGNNTDSGSSDNSGDDHGPPFDFSPGVGAHALLMVLSFLIIFPGGYLFLRLFEKVWLHWSIQSLGTFVVILASAVGIAVSKKENRVSSIEPVVRDSSARDRQKLTTSFFLASENRRPASNPRHPRPPARRRLLVPRPYRPYHLPAHRHTREAYAGTPRPRPAYRHPGANQCMRRLQLCREQQTDYRICDCYGAHDYRGIRRDNV